MKKIYYPIKHLDSIEKVTSINDNWCQICDHLAL